MNMIRTEKIGDYTHTYSDAGMKILQNETGIVYDDAMDVPAMKYTYTETTTPIEDRDITAEEALNILLGGESNE